MIDVVVLGGGSAGAAAAWQCARAGLRVALLEKGRLDRAGARWSNGVVGWGFDEAGLPRPTAPEGRGAPAMHLVAGWGPTSLLVTGQDVLEVDMRHLVARLQRLAGEAGADLREGVAATGLRDDGVDTTAGPVRARWVVDATGLLGVTAGRVPREDLCTAVQEVYTLRDARAAEAFFRSRGARPGEVLCFTSVAGGYSIVNVRVHDDEVALLTGSMPGLGAPSARVLADRFVAAHPWIGALRFGGARAIPVGPAAAPLAEGRLARLGDVAGQVYAAHGSGIAVQLVSARLLAEALAAGGTPDDYARRVQARFGAVLDASRRFQRFSRSIDAADLERLMRSGLMTVPLVKAGLEQRPFPVDPGTLAGIVRGAVRTPGLVARFAPVVAEAAWDRWADRVRAR